MAAIEAWFEEKGSALGVLEEPDVAELEGIAQQDGDCAEAVDYLTKAIAEYARFAGIDDFWPMPSQKSPIEALSRIGACNDKARKRILECLEHYAISGPAFPRIDAIKGLAQIGTEEAFSCLVRAYRHLACDRAYMPRHHAEEIIRQLRNAGAYSAIAECRSHQCKGSSGM